MLIKPSIILLVLKFSVCQFAKVDWELAVVVENQIRLLTSNGTLVHTKDQPFSSLKALAYDNVRDQFIVSDMHLNNDTVYTVQIDEHTTEPIIQGLPGNVQGLAIDPIDDMLYWTDEINHTIHHMPLKKSESYSKEFKVLEDKTPHALAIDVCQRYLYFTNSIVSKPTIDRIRLDGTGHEVFVDNFLMTPEGITIDYKAQRLYWADSRGASSGGRIESIGLDGRDRKIVIERNTMQPFGLAVDEEAIYWTDTNNYGLYKIMKGQDPEAVPKILAKFTEKPMGLVSNNHIIKQKPDCEYLKDAIRKYKEEEKKEQPEPFEFVEQESIVKDCLNSGVLLGASCNCPRGFTGKRCEISLCQNLCLNGVCYMSSSGKPICRCFDGFLGDRCQKNKCDGYCLNGGECDLHSPKNVPIPRCRCSNGFIGEQCEYNNQICDIYCTGNGLDARLLEKYKVLCRCENEESFYSRRNHTAAAFISSTDNNDDMDLASNPVIYLSVLVVFCMMIIAALSLFICNIQKRRPRIKKRIIVNKNVTPLTYRPQQSIEQCEITIENCCNMNVCETPCFDPREDKKKLLKNMEGEDIY